MSESENKVGGFSIDVMCRETKVSQQLNNCSILCHVFILSLKLKHISKVLSKGKNEKRSCSYQRNDRNSKKKSGCIIRI